MRDRLSFTKFLGLGLEDAVPNAATVLRYREQLVQARVVDDLFRFAPGAGQDLVQDFQAGLSGVNALGLSAFNLGIGLPYFKAPHLSETGGTSRIDIGG